MKKIAFFCFLSFGLMAGAFAAEVSADRMAAAAAARNRMPSMPTAGVFQSINMTSNAPQIAAQQQPLPPTPEPPIFKCPDAPNVIIDGGKCTCKNGYDYNEDKKICECNKPKVEQDGQCVKKERPPKEPDATVDDCMKAVLACINGGALPGGLTDLYNSDLRHSIENGMNLCASQVDWCIANVKICGKPVYRTAADVWLDFNSRIVQPNYYSFILRKTGLTPYQAENTCMLLDRNTYAASYNAVSGTNRVTSEYANREYAYNGQGGAKANPQGAQVNNGTASAIGSGQYQQGYATITNRGGGFNGGIDANRGYYARWDATTGECLVRVAAYNKDKQISNKWLFGALGNDKDAEAWVKSGENFSCGKDLFGFSLLNDTSTAAVVGIGGGTVVGATVGGIVGHNKGRQFDCANDGDRKKLWKEIWDGRLTGLNNYIDSVNALDSTTSSMDITQCEAVVGLLDIVATAKGDPCYTGQVAAERGASAEDMAMLYQATVGINRVSVRGNGTIAISSASNDGYCALKFKRLITAASGSLRCQAGNGCLTSGDFRMEVENLNNMLSKLTSLQGRESKTLQGALIGAGTGAAAGGLATAITAFVERNNISCRVGDGLERVGFGKGGKVESLKEYYVKWNLNLPDTIMPTAQVSDCKSWDAACGMIQLKDCESTQINYKPRGATTVVLIDGACMLSGSVCVRNDSVALSYNACEKDDYGGWNDGSCRDYWHDGKEPREPRE